MAACNVLSLPEYFQSETPPFFEFGLRPASIKNRFYQSTLLKKDQSRLSLLLCHGCQNQGSRLLYKCAGHPTIRSCISSWRSFFQISLNQSLIPNYLPLISRKHFVLEYNTVFLPMIFRQEKNQVSKYDYHYCKQVKNICVGSSFLFSIPNTSHLTFKGIISFFRNLIVIQLPDIEGT